jgi:nitrite reductase/ring-hydroxylating ferredoxin subunit
MAVRERDLGVIGPVLSDGTPLADLIDVERREASLRLLHDPEVYELELEYLFARSWLILGHETEIPNVGDYVVRKMAEDPVIMVRDRDGEIRVLLNVCTHRGMQVCRAEVGNATKFRCPYHGWVFGEDGSFLAAPFEKEMYGDVLDKPALGLQRARVATYAGIVFANWDDTAPPLDEFLGDFAWYLDTQFKRTTSGLEVAGAPQRFVVRSNWKAVSEQFCGADGYHALTLHKSLMEMTAQQFGMDVNVILRHVMDGVDVGSKQGHGMRCIPFQLVAAAALHGVPQEQVAQMTPIELLTLQPPVGMSPDLVPQLAEQLTEGQLRAMVTYAPGPGGVFPNVGYVDTAFRVYNPLGPDTFEMLNFPMVEKDAPQEVRDLALAAMIHQNGASGTVEQDDAEAWPAIQTSARGFQGRKQAFRYHAFMGNHPPEAGWGGGAETYTGFSGDDCPWNWWLRYRDYMVGRPW